MKLRSILLASAAFSIIATPALADPFSVGSAILTAIASLGPAGSSVALSIFTAVGTSAVGTLALAAASVGLQFGLNALNRQRLPVPEAVKNTTQGETGPGRHLAGRAIVGGRVPYGRTTGYTLHRLLLSHFEETDGDEQYYVNGIPVVVEADGNVSSPPWAKVGGSWLNIKMKPGDGTETAWSELTAAYPSEWTSQHRVRGIAQMLVTATNPGTSSPLFGKLYQKGFPEVTRLTRAGKFYDPRDGSTAWTMNAAIIALHYFRQVSGYRDADINWPRMAAAANWCDEVVATLSGTAPRSQLTAAWEGVVDMDKVLTMLDCAGLEMRVGSDDLVYFAGIEDFPAPELTLPFEHVLQWERQDGPEGLERANRCRVKYFSPERLYNVEEIPGVVDLPWASVDAEISAYGDREAMIELPFCPNVSQAQRIARRKFWMSRSEIIVCRTSMAGRALDRLNCIDIELDGFGDDGAHETVRCTIEDWTDDAANGTCELVLRPIPAMLQKAFNAARDEAAAPPALVPGEYDAEIDAPAAPSAATVVQYPTAGTYETRVSFSGVAGAVQAEVLYNTYDLNGDPVAPQSLDDALVSGSGAGASWVGFEELNLLGEKVRFRARVFNVNEEGSNLSDALVVPSMTTDNTAPATPAVSAIYNAGNWDYQITLGGDLSVVGIVIETRISTGSWAVAATADAQPFETIEGTVAAATGMVPYTTQIRVKARTTDGTASAYSTTISELVSI